MKLTHLFAFVLPTSIMFLVYRAFGMHPFGDESLLIMDMSDQYVEFYTYLRGIFDNNNSLFFSWSKGMGQSFWGLFAYYLSSPFSWLIFLFPKNNIQDAIYFLTVVKIGLAGLTFSLFLRFTQCVKDNLKHNLSIIIFSTFYALMSYNIIYAMCPMWLDGTIFLPLIIWGVHRIVHGESPLLYIASLSMMIISNYYIAYMICIFTVLYYLYYWYTQNAPLRQALTFAISSLTAGLLTLWFTLPVIFDNFQGKTHLFATPKNPDNFPFQDLFQKFLPGNYSSIINSENFGGLPYIYCGLAVSALFVVYLFSQKFLKKERYASLALFAIIIASFYISAIDTAWHMFRLPNWFPYRYSFVLSFFMAAIAYRMFVTLKLNKLYIWALMIVCVIDMSYNAYKIIDGLDKQFAFRAHAEYIELREDLQPFLSIITPWSDEFFRADKDFRRSRNDSMGLSYNAITHFSSAYNIMVNDFLSNIGFENHYFWSDYTSYRITDAIFNVRYVLAKGDVPYDYKIVKERGDITLYENPYYLSIGFMVHKDAADLQYSPRPLKMQSDLLGLMTNRYGSYFDDNNDLNLEKFKIDVAELGRHQLRVTEVTNTSVKGNITVPWNKTLLFTSIPYDEGWAITVNGKKVKPQKFYDTFICLELDPGQYEIHMSFTPKGLKTGIAISAFTLTLLLFFIRSRPQSAVE